jgi:hypothetical protein
MHTRIATLLLRVRTGGRAISIDVTSQRCAARNGAPPKTAPRRHNGSYQEFTYGA